MRKKKRELNYPTPLTMDEIEALSKGGSKQAQKVIREIEKLEFTLDRDDLGILTNYKVDKIDEDIERTKEEIELRREEYEKREEAKE